LDDIPKFFPLIQNFPLYVGLCSEMNSLEMLFVCELLHDVVNSTVCQLNQTAENV